MAWPQLASLHYGRRSLGGCRPLGLLDLSPEASQLSVGSVEFVLDVLDFHQRGYSQLSGSRAPCAAAARMRDASFTCMAGVCLSMGRRLVASSSAAFISWINSG